MKSLFKISLALLLVVCMANVSLAVKKITKVKKAAVPTTVANQSAEEVLTTKGKITKVDSELGMIYIKQDGRTIQFQADGTMCYALAKKINKKVEIKYIKSEDGTLIAKDFKLKK